MCGIKSVILFVKKFEKHYSQKDYSHNKIHFLFGESEEVFKSRKEQKGINMRKDKILERKKRRMLCFRT